MDATRREKGFWRESRKMLKVCAKFLIQKIIRPNWYTRSVFLLWFSTYRDPLKRAKSIACELLSLQDNHLKSYMAFSRSQVLTKSHQITETFYSLAQTTDFPLTSEVKKRRIYLYGTKWEKYIDLIQIGQQWTSTPEGPRSYHQQR